MALPDWRAIQSLETETLTALFAKDSQRVEALSADVSGIHFDWSKTHLTGEAVAAFSAIAETMGLAARRDALFAGDAVNVTEGRAAEHTAERGEGSPESVTIAKAFHNRMRALIDAIEAEAFGPVRAVLHVGIGGSALGPQLLVDALGGRLHVLDNTDPDGIQRTLAGLPSLAHTLVLVTSKSGATVETRNGMLEVTAACTRAGLDFGRQAVAITGVGSHLDTLAKAQGWRARFPLWDWVGGRTSVLSAVGLLPAALLGLDWQGLLRGAAAMDVATRNPEVRSNPAAMLAHAWFVLTGGRGAIRCRHADPPPPQPRRSIFRRMS